MSTDGLIVISNFLLCAVTLIASLVTVVDIHRDEQKTLRMILFGRLRIAPRSRRGKHE